MTELIFYAHPMSRARIVRWMLEEVGVPYATRMLDFGTSMKAPEFLAINPMGKVPTIVHDGQVVTEAAAICAYLAEAFPEAGLAPHAGEHADYYRWMFFAAGPLEAAVTARALNVAVPDDRKAMVGFGSMDDVLAALEGLLDSRPYVTGNRFTAADVYVGAQIRWSLDFGTIPSRPAFKAYADRLGERPALVRATAIDDDLMPRPASS
jgi:glutathione S-transferase